MRERQPSPAAKDVRRASLPAGLLIQLSSRPRHTPLDMSSTDSDSEKVQRLRSALEGKTFIGIDNAAWRYQNSYGEGFEFYTLLAQATFPSQVTDDSEATAAGQYLMQMYTRVRDADDGTGVASSGAVDAITNVPTLLELARELSATQSGFNVLANRAMKAHGFVIDVSFVSTAQGRNTLTLAATYLEVIASMVCDSDSTWSEGAGEAINLVPAVLAKYKDAASLKRDLVAGPKGDFVAGLPNHGQFNRAGTWT
jgi:hypothetical protein